MVEKDKDMKHQIPITQFRNKFYMTNSSPTNDENIIPSPLMGEGEGGGELIIRYSPSPQSSPTKGEEVIFHVIQISKF
jgi:hypothetical protein